MSKSQRRKDLESKSYRILQRIAADLEMKSSEKTKPELITAILLEEKRAKKAKRSASKSTKAVEKDEKSE